jgi:dextranase
MEEREQHLSRRRFLRLSAAAAATAAIAACSRQGGGEGAAPAATPTAAPANTVAAAAETPTAEAVAAATSTSPPSLDEILSAVTPDPPTPAPTEPPAPTGLLERVTTDKAMYAPNEPVTIAVELRNRTGAPFEGQVTLAFFHLAAPAADEQSQPVPALAPDAAATLTFTWNPPATDFRGYRVEVLARDGAGETTLDAAATAVDVSSDWKKFPRYGFVSRFDGAVDRQGVMAALNAYHLNGIQFYDWQWQHHRPYSPEPTWPDIANRVTMRDTVVGLIDAAHSRSMVTMHYSLAFGAYDNYWQDGSGVETAWGLFKDDSGSIEKQDFHPLPGGWATSKLYLMNPGNPSWQQYIFGQQQAVFEHFAFDGWHIDTLGNRGPLWDGEGQPLDLASTFAGFTNNAKAALNKRVLFNAVGGYGQDEIAAGADVDFIYTELWEYDGISTYGNIFDVAARAKAQTDKALVFPAYMNRAYAQATAGGTRFFNEPSVRLANAAIFAAGASHLELGDDNAMLSTEYFPSQALEMRDALKAAMQDYYDFLVAYENLLRDDISEVNGKVVLEGVETSTTGQAGAVWTILRRRSDATIVHLINLKSAPSNLWRDDQANYPPPEVLSNLALKIPYRGELRADAGLFYATPDSDHGKAISLPFTAGSDADGTFVAATLPQLQYWALIWLEQ